MQPLADTYGHPHAADVSIWWWALPLIGWAYLLYRSLARPGAIENAILHELSVRKPDPTAWEACGYLDATVANRVLSVLKNRIWSHDAVFHPEDPWWLIGQVKTGDLVEEEYLMDIEDSLCLPYDPNAIAAVSDMTLAQVIAYFTHRYRSSA